MIELKVNGSLATVESKPLERLSDVLRGPLGLSGTKVGCNTGDCGACTVLVDDKPVCSCITAVAQVQGCSIETVEGLEESGQLSLLQKSFLRHGAAQCGICTPGMLMSAQALLRRSPQPTQMQVEDALGGVLCRCTGYRKIVQAVMHAQNVDQSTAAPARGQNVGVSVRHLDGKPKITGALKFGADNIPDDALALRLVRSEHHAARFTLGDIEGFVDSREGLVCVLSARDIPGSNCFGVIPPFADQPVFAERQVLYRGEAVAAIVGKPQAIIDLNLDDFPIEWDVLNAVLTPEQALNSDNSTLHKARKHNILVRGLVERGDAQTVLNDCAYTTTVTSSTPFIEHGYIEPEAGYAQRAGNRIEIFGCTQAAHMDKDAIAEIMGLETDNVRVVPSACGGGFGSKLDISFQPYIALAAWVTNKPVSLCYTRPESMRSTTKRHPSSVVLTAGCDEQGIIQAFDFEATFNTGAYASWGPTVANRVPVHASGPYSIPNYRARSLAVHTNTPPAGAFRGFGVPQSAIAQERAFDELAEQLGMDKLEFRLRNALVNGSPTVTGQVFDSGVGIVDCLQALQTVWLEALDDAATFNASEQARVATQRKGVGLATCWYGCGNTSLPNPSTIRLGIKVNGDIVLHQGAMDIGQGANTVIAQIAADALGVSVFDLVLVDGDTDLTPDAGKTSASRQTFISGAAAKQAGEALRATLLRHANVGVDAQISTADGYIELKSKGDGPAVTLSLNPLPVNDFGYVFMAEETYDPISEPLDENGQGLPYALYGYGAQLVQLTVDTRFGTVKVDHITTSHDVGKAINPLLVEGQIEGGVAQGIGMALMEDYQPGKTENLHDYLMPTIGDIPEFTHFIVEVEDPVGPYGAKGLGEHVLIPTAPAIVNAIRHATGAVITDLPCTPDKVLAAIQNTEKQQ